MTQSAKDIQKDHERAQNYAIKYGKRISNAFLARSSILNLAMNQFNRFLVLPEESNNASAIWDLAWLALSTAVPVLRLGKFVTEQHRAATLALEIAKKTGQKAKLPKVVKTVTGAGIGAGKLANKANDLKEKAEKFQETYGKATDDGESLDEQFQDFDLARKVLYDMLSELDKATQSFETALDAELAEYENRIDGLKPSKEGSLESHMKELLKPYPKLTRDELKQVELRFLWEMIAAWAQKNVKIVATTNVYTTTTSSKTAIEGLNETQQKFILETFGPYAKRGAYFPFAPVWNIIPYLGHIGIKPHYVRVQLSYERGNKS
jgi:hypothetical protein